MKYLKPKKKSKFPVFAMLSGIAIVLVLVCLFLIRAINSDVPANPKPSEQMETAASATEAPEEVTEAIEEQTVSTEPEVVTEPEPQILPYFQELVAENSDMVGWIKIDGTKLDYPLMYTPGDNEKYLHKDFEGNFSVGGLPFLDEKCSLEPQSDNLIIYGHNMQNGSMFRSLMGYDQVNYFWSHPTIHMSTLYEETEYEIMAAFYDRVYLTTENCFKFYQFIDAEDEEDFMEAVEYFKSHSLYDTGVTAEYGDKLITLVTCAYHTENGRFVVVARARGE